MTRWANYGHTESRVAKARLGFRAVRNSYYDDERTIIMERSLG